MRLAVPARSDFPPWQTVYGYFAAWRDDGILTRLHDALRAQVRTAAGRNAEPTAAVIDSQSVRAADTVPKATRGWDNAKKRRTAASGPIAVDTAGLLLAVVITPAIAPGPQRRPAAAVEPAPGLPPRPPGSGRCRVRRQAGPWAAALRGEYPDRGQARPACL